MNLLFAKKRASIRAEFTVVFLLLGGWGIIISVFRFSDSLESYRENRRLIEWAKISENLLISVQHYSFERGRSAVVLRGAEPVSELNRTFIDDRRRRADEAFGKSEEILKTVPEARYDIISQRLHSLRDMRAQVDRNAALSRGLRDGGLPDRWYGIATGLVESLQYAVDILIGNYMPGDSRRLATFASTALELRIAAGNEASLVAQAASEGKAPSAMMMGRIHRLRGVEDRLWYELVLDAGYLRNEGLRKKAEEVKSRHMERLRRAQDIVLADMASSRPLSITVQALIAESPPTLDGISDLSVSAAHEALISAEKGTRAALEDLAGNIAWFVVLAALLGYSIRYVGRNIVGPLEKIDGELHRIGAFDSKEHPGNEIDRLGESTVALERTLTARAEAESDREKTIRELKYAMEQVRTLSGFLPICANCKNVRDDQGYWGQVEEYISKHSDVQFSHGLCPDCAQKLYGHLNLKKDS